MKKPKSPAAEKIQMTPEMVKAFMEESMWQVSALHDESDRGAVLVGAAALDEALSLLISSYFLDDQRVTKDLLDNQKALGTFSAKIDIAYCCGLLSKRERKDLHLIRKIRNDFAHSLKTASFGVQEISNRCAQLESCNGAAPSTLKTSRGRFIRATVHLTASIGLRRFKVSRCRLRAEGPLGNGERTMKLAAERVGEMDPKDLIGWEKDRLGVYKKLLGPEIETLVELIEEKQKTESGKSQPKASPKKTKLPD